MNTQRHTPEELDEIADTLRDQALHMALIKLPPAPQGLHESERSLTSQIDCRVGLVRLLRDEAARLRRLHELASKRD